MDKLCSKCRHYLPLVNFNKNKKQHDGYHNQCKSCRSRKVRIDIPYKQKVLSNENIVLKKNINELISEIKSLKEQLAKSELLSKRWYKYSDDREKENGKLRAEIYTLKVKLGLRKPVNEMYHFDRLIKRGTPEWIQYGYDEQFPGE